MKIQFTLALFNKKWFYEFCLNSDQACLVMRSLNVLYNLESPIIMIRNTGDVRLVGYRLGLVSKFNRVIWDPLATESPT